MKTIQSILALCLASAPIFGAGALRIEADMPSAETASRRADLYHRHPETAGFPALVHRALTSEGSGNGSLLTPRNIACDPRTQPDVQTARAVAAFYAARPDLWRETVERPNPDLMVQRDAIQAVLAANKLPADAFQSSNVVIDFPDAPSPFKVIAFGNMFYRAMHQGAPSDEDSCGREGKTWADRKEQRNTRNGDPKTGNYWTARCLDEGVRRGIVIRGTDPKAAALEPVNVDERRYKDTETDKEYILDPTTRAYCAPGYSEDPRFHPERDVPLIKRCLESEEPPFYGAVTGMANILVMQQAIKDYGLDTLAVPKASLYTQAQEGCAANDRNSVLILEKVGGTFDPKTITDEEKRQLELLIKVSGHPWDPNENIVRGPDGKLYVGVRSPEDPSNSPNCFADTPVIGNDHDENLDLWHLQHRGEQCGLPRLAEMLKPMPASADQQ